jgi:hypothetical protein
MLHWFEASDLSSHAMLPALDAQAEMAWFRCPVFIDSRVGAYIRWDFRSTDSANPIFFNSLEIIIQVVCLVTPATMQEVVDIDQGLPDDAALWLRSFFRASTCFSLGDTAGSAYP